jgi:pyrroloquinoline quinone biosynthesis protein B
MRAKILGTAQDGGIPHLGCECEACSTARDDRTKQRFTASLKVYDEEKGTNYLFDATPDIRFQVDDTYIDGIFLGHGELGTITGLLYLGKESINANMVPVYCTASVHDYLKDNYAFRLLIDRNNIVINEFENEQPIEAMGFSVTPIDVVHRYVPTDTHAFMINTDDTKLLYMTDIDYWTEEALQHVRNADIALIDGTFWSEEEIDRFERVPHPPIQETLEKLADADTEIYFMHLNHTNPVLDPDAEERQQVEDAGFHVAEEGMELEL